MINEDNYWSYSLNDLMEKSYPNKDIILCLYQSEVNNLLECYPQYSDIINSEESLDWINYELDLVISENISECILPGQELYYIPITCERRSSCDRTCMISGAPITKGSFYLGYKAFLYNKKFTYVSSLIIMENGAEFYIPRSLHEFENLYFRIMHSYEQNREIEYNILSSGFRLIELSHYNKKYK